MERITSIIQTCFLVPFKSVTYNGPLQGLRARGHELDLGRAAAVTQAIVVDPDHDILIGASDPRKDGAPAGF